MSNDNSDLTGFLAELQEQFGKKKKVKQAPRPADIVKAMNKASFDVIENRGNSLSIANSIASAEKFKEMWKPVGKEVWIKVQHCVTCGSSSDHIAGEYVVFESRKLHSNLKRRMFHHTDEYYFNHDLESTVVEIEQDVSRCPSCVRLGKKIDEIWDYTFSKDDTPKQAEIELPGLDKLLDMETR